MDALPAAIFPDAGVGLERLALGALAERLQQLKQAVIARPRQAPVEKHRHGGKDDAAIGIVLRLADGGVADRAPARRRDSLRDWAPLCSSTSIRRDDAVERPQLLVRFRGDRDRKRDEFLHRARRADAVERLDDEIGVPQPAIAIVPGAAGAGRFRNRRGMRSNNRPRFVEVAQLQRDGGADDRFLPIVGDRQPAHPFHPVVAGAVDEVAAGRLQVAGKRLVRPEHQVHRPREHERRLAVDQRQRRVGGQAYDGALAGIADVVAAKRVLHQRLAVVAGRAHPDGDARQAGDRLDDAKDLRRTENATELAEARHEVGDSGPCRLAIDQHAWRRSRCCARIRTDTPPCRRARRRRIPSPPCRPAIGEKIGSPSKRG